MQPTTAGAAGLAGPESRLEYAIQGGPEMEPGLHEIDTSLRIDLVRGEAFLEQHQPSSSEGGEPLGTFKGPLSAALLSHLRAAVTGETWWSLPPSTTGGREAA